jgi:hypothetical protein
VELNFIANTCISDVHKEDRIYTDLETLRIAIEDNLFKLEGIYANYYGKLGFGCVASPDFKYEVYLVCKDIKRGWSMLHSLLGISELTYSITSDPLLESCIQITESDFKTSSNLYYNLATMIGRN